MSPPVAPLSRGNVCYVTYNHCLLCLVLRTTEFAARLLALSPFAPSAHPQPDCFVSLQLRGLWRAASTTNQLRWPPSCLLAAAVRAPTALQLWRRSQRRNLQRCRVGLSMSTARDGAAGQLQRGLDYATLQAHGLQEPALVQHAAFIEPAARAVSPQPEPESAVQLVKNEAGRWQLQRVLGESEPPVAALKRPGAEQAAAIRKRKACVHALTCLLLPRNV